MPDDIPTALKLFIAITGVIYVTKMYFDAKARHPVFTYDQHSAPNLADWRWRKPDFTYPHSPKLRFEGKLESVFELTRDHEEPDYKLFILQPHFLFFSKQKRFILHANESQGSWKVAGLNHWRERT